MQTAYMSLGEACERLGVPPRTFRQLLADFGDLIEAPKPSADGRLLELSVVDVERLQQMLQLRNRGLTVEAIRQQFLGQAQPQAVAAAAPEVAATVETAESAAPPADDTQVAAEEATQSSGVVDARAPHVEAAPTQATAADLEADFLQRQAQLVERLEQLTEELSRSEERRIDERDRLLMTLIRTQREIQHLRYEVAAHVTRRGRKQLSWVARWFG